MRLSCAPVSGAVDSAEPVLSGSEAAMAAMSAQHDEVMAEINITPFTDVLLVLLIIFMLLAAMMTPPGFQKSLADSGKAPPHPVIPPKSISVLVNARGVIFIDDR